MKMLPLLLALIVVPAWAGDAAPVTEQSVNIELKGATKSLSALVADLEKEAVYKEAGCSSKPVKSGKIAKISCVKADSTLMAFLSKNAPAKVNWTISSTATSASKAPAAASAEITPLGCPVGCALMACPPPSGPVKCCNVTTHGSC